MTLNNKNSVDYFYKYCLDIRVKKDYYNYTKTI